MEYAAAKSSICRQCGRSFSPFAPKPGLKLRTKEEAPAPESPSFLGRFEDCWKRQRSAIIECFECKRKQQVSGAATSTICPACIIHIDVRDYTSTIITIHSCYMATSYDSLLSLVHMPRVNVNASHRRKVLLDGDR